MKTSIALLFVLILVIISSCTEIEIAPEDDFVYNEPDFSQGILTPEILWSFKRIGQTKLSPDGKKVIYALSYYSIEQNRSKREIFMIDLKTDSTIRLTHNNFNEYSPVWRPDGEKIAFLAADEKGIMQIWEMNKDGTQAKAITKREKDISNFKYAPTNDKILFTSDVKIYQSTKDIHPDLPNANAKIITDLLFRHWDRWEDEFFSHIFCADYSPGLSEIKNIIDIMPDEPYDTPLYPFDGVENIAWSPDGSKIAYTCKKMEGKEYVLSTNSDIYIYDIKTGKTENLTKNNLGYDKNPVFSNNGNKIAWESMEREGYEADKIRIFVYDFNKSDTVNYSDSLDMNAHNLVWSDNDSKIYFISGKNATYQIFSINLKNKKLKQITKGIHNYTNFSLAKNYAIANRMSMSSPIEIFKVNIKTGEQKQISFVNKDILKKITLGKIEKRWITTTDNKKMLTWIIYPPNFNPNKKYPTLLYCQGGPQSAVSQFFSYRWNFQIMAANDYIIVAPNRRGLPSFGQEWNEQISKDYGGQNALDLLTAIDTMAKEPFIDENNLGALGASYGGFSVFWLAGNHKNRFKAFIAHDGIFNFISMYGSTEELWFVNWDTGGPYWEPTKPNSYDASPHLFVENWDTPIMIVQGAKDFRVPETQAFEAFTAAKLMDVDAKLLYFPEENHWVLTPQNGILWQREFFKWLDKYLK